MKYTKEIPTKPGWYWVRGLFGMPRIFEIDKTGFKGEMEIVTHNEYVEVSNRFEYAGPIEEPEE